MKPFPKGRTKRSAPLPQWLVEHLDGEPGRRRCGSVHRTGSRCRSPLVPAGRVGKVVDYDSWHRVRWLDACACAWAEVGHGRVHDLRPTSATRQLHSGQVSIEALPELTGQASIAVTQ